LTVTTIASISLVFLTSVIVARVLGPDGKGIYDLMAASASMGSLILGLSLPAGITFAVARGILASTAVPSSALIWSVGVAVASAVLLAVGHPAFVAIGVLSPGSGLVDLALISTLAGVSASGAMLRAALAGAGRVELGARLDLLGRALALTATFALAPGATPASLLFALIVGGLVGAVASAIAIRPVGLVGRVPARVIAGYSLRAHGANVFQFLNYRLDLFIVALFRGPTEVGLYALAATLGQLVWVLSGSVAASLFPAVAVEAEPVRSAGRTALAARLTLAVSLVAAIVGAALAVPGVRIIYGDAFASATIPLLALLPGVVLLVPIRVIAAYFAGIGRPTLNLAISAVSFIATIGLDLLLIPDHGMVGAAVASTMSYGLAAISGLMLFRRISGVPLTHAILIRSTDLALAAGAFRRPSGEEQARRSEDA